MAMRREWLVAMVLAKFRHEADFVSPDTATKLRGAWAIYETLRHHSPSKARELRGKYGYRRFLEMGALWLRYEFSAEDAIDHMESELSTAAMKMQIIDAHDEAPEWKRKAGGILKYCGIIATSYDAPAEWREWARRGMELMQK
jgi:hypothetical protein